LESTAASPAARAPEDTAMRTDVNMMKI